MSPGKIISILTNRFLLVTVGFVVWMSVFDRNNFFNQWELYADMKKLETEKQYFIEEIKADRQTATELKTNLRNLEKFAREKYLMKKDNEDIYLVIPESAPKQE
jgi:cell division protein FtsB